jgi:hypothetical protein
VAEFTIDYREHLSGRTALGGRAFRGPGWLLYQEP